jgi:hypothetical protein
VKTHSYDAKCFELAKHFVPEEFSLEETRELAQAIQDCIETYLDSRASGEAGK